MDGDREGREEEGSGGEIQGNESGAREGGWGRDLREGGWDGVLLLQVMHMQMLKHLPAMCSGTVITITA